MRRKEEKKKRTRGRKEEKSPISLSEGREKERSEPRETKRKE
jgi:hypothetical protein